MSRGLFKRLGTTLLVVWGAVTLIFLLIRLAPGDPALVMLGPTATEDQLAALRDRLGLGGSLVHQYAIFLKDLVQFDFGMSVRLGKPAMDAVLERLPATLELTFWATILSVGLGIPLGALAGRRPGGWVDKLVSSLALFGKSLPGFWLGVILILIFARQFRILPSFGSGSFAHLILPTITMTLPFLAIVIRLTRSTVVDTLREPFVLTAYAKGLREREVLADHVVRNSLLPVVTMTGLQLTTLVGGAVVTETVFSWPGIGSLLVASVAARDYAVVQAIAIVVALMVAFINVITDLVYAQLDPRIRLGGQQ
ncbi:ABC transporter permease [Devosia faecipullorum]|uniref:ABC transporter permease n=1 Tax=Devosia faecipullorum TaxID=2755039 RepID=UPI00187B438D|nr:ABC transporter permease [Devosia faecipullorum]MBE7732876.1 ABC transporter permease [Devosia faecipullorum]